MFKLAVSLALVACAFAKPSLLHEPEVAHGLSAATSYQTVVKSPVVAEGPAYVQTYAAPAYAHTYAAPAYVKAYSAHPAPLAYTAQAASLAYAVQDPPLYYH